MADPVVHWPGMQLQESPGAAVLSATGRTPIFSGDYGPRYTGPFNAGGKYGAMLEMAMPSIMQMMMGNKYTPTQFFPEQNLYDQLQADQFFQANQRAMAMAASRDARSISRTLGGLTQMMTGEALTPMQAARNNRIASGVSQYMPMITQILGPDLVDQLHGSRGSATVFAQQIHQAMRTGLDPVTGRVGYSGESAGLISQSVFDRLFSDQNNIDMLKGMSAGQAGMLLNDLQARGLLGTSTGGLPLAEQRAGISRTLSRDAVDRLARELPAIRQITEQGGIPTDVEMNAARGQITDTHAKLTDPNVAMTQKDLEGLPGAENLIRESDATRITKRLQNLSGAVKAMRDIFGDMGRPNAPMREILNGLDALTQGGLATMPPAQLEMMVRRTHTIAKQTGVGVEGLLGLSAQNAELADRLGLDRSFAVTSAQQSAMFAAAAGDRLRLDIPAWGAPTKEQLLLGDQQLRMHAAASPLANQMNAVLRMSDTGMIQNQGNTELASLVEALRKGNTTYAFGGRQNDIAMPHARLLGMLKRDAGVQESQAYAVLQDIRGNQEFGQRYNTPNTIRQLQTSETVRRMLTPVLGSRIQGIASEAGIDQVMQAQGLVGNATEFREMMNRVGQGVGTDFLAMDPATVRSAVKKKEAISQAFRQRLRNEVATKMPNAAPAEIDTVLNSLVSQLGGDAGMSNIGTAIAATINQTAASNPVFQTDIRMHNLLNRDAMKQADTRAQQAEVAAITQSAMMGLGNADPVQRMIDVFQSADKDTTLHDALSRALGGVSTDAIKAADPEGGLAKVFDLIQENKSLNPADPAQLDKIRRNAQIIRGLVEGGDVASEQLNMLDASRETIGEADIAKATTAQKAAALQSLQDRESRQRTLREAQLTNQEAELTQAESRLTALDDQTLTVDQRQATEQTLQRTVRAMVTSLPNRELSLGANKFLTPQGIVERDADGKTITTTPLADQSTLQTAVRALRSNQLTNKSQLETDRRAADAEPVETRLQRASREGLLRGNLTVGNDQLYAHLQAATKREADTSILGVLGYQAAAAVSFDQVQAITDRGNIAATMLGDATAADTEKTEAVGTFLEAVNTRGQQLLDDERSMRIIGHGSTELVNDAITQASTLQQLVQTESKRTGRSLTTADLFNGKAGQQSQATATQLFHDLRKTWGEIDKRRTFGVLPGEGDDPENKNRVPMSDQELNDLRHQQEFRQQHATAADRATAAVDRMISLATPEQQARMRVDVNRAALIEAATSGDRGIELDQAVHGREALLEMGIRKGVFGDKRNISDLSDTERQDVLQRLEAAPLSEIERADMSRLRQQSEILNDFGTSHQAAGAITQNALGRINQLATKESPTDNGQDRKLNVVVTGNVTQKSDGTADLELSGTGIMDAVTHALGL